MPTVSGVVKDSAGAFARRYVRVLNRATCGVLGETLSDATTGAYSVSVPTTDEVIVLAHDVSNADPYWSSVVLAMHMDGTNGSTTFTDVKGKVVTAYGNAQISTAQSKFGGASAYLDGTGDYLSLPTSSDFAFGSGDFTIECWVYLDNVSGNKTVVQIFPTGGRAWDLLIGGATTNFRATVNGTNDAVNITGPNLTASAWNHIAVVRSGTAVTLYTNGVAGTPGTLTGSIFTPTSGPNIGRNMDNAWYFAGYIDDLRITKGVARYTANFTPPSLAFGEALSGGTENAVVLDRVVPV